jgi:hypothetical protein
MATIAKNFDYLSYSDDLKEAGFSEKQARSLLHLQRNMTTHILENVATKEDIMLLESKLELKIERMSNKILWSMGAAIILAFISHFLPLA